MGDRQRRKRHSKDLLALHYPHLLSLQPSLLRKSQPKCPTTIPSSPSRPTTVLLRVNSDLPKASTDLLRASTTLLNNKWDTSKDLPPCSKHHRRRTADAWPPAWQ